MGRDYIHEVDRVAKETVVNHRVPSKKIDMILAAIAAGDGITYSPVQIQKLLFLVDKKIPWAFDGPHFNFIPYDYGPFDVRIYSNFAALSIGGFVEIVREPELRWHKYRLTPKGLTKGHEILGKLEEPARKFIYKLNKFVMSLSFGELIASVYKAYPDMRVNSVFQG
jgi:uncharacterized protein